ncbi:hypothetical protein FQZ97_647270 [compost metagenome]
MVTGCAGSKGTRQTFGRSLALRQNSRNSAAPFDSALLVRSQAESTRQPRAWSALSAAPVAVHAAFRSSITSMPARFLSRKITLRSSAAPMRLPGRPSVPARRPSISMMPLRVRSRCGTPTGPTSGDTPAIGGTRGLLSQKLSLLFCTQSGVTTTGMRAGAMMPGAAALLSRCQAQALREPSSTGRPAALSSAAAAGEGAQALSISADTSGTTDRSAYIALPSRSAARVLIHGMPWLPMAARSSATLRARPIFIQLSAERTLSVLASRIA